MAKIKEELPVKKVKFSFTYKNEKDNKVEDINVQEHKIDGEGGDSLVIYARKEEKRRGRSTKSNESKNAFPQLKPVVAKKMSDKDWLTQAGAADDRPESIQFIHSNWAADGFRLHKIEDTKECNCKFCKNKKLAEDGKIDWGDSKNPTSPQWEQLFPRHFNGEFTIDRDKLIGACNQARVYAREGSNVVRLSIEESHIEISATSEEYGESVTHYDNGEGYTQSGKGLLIAFNVEFILDAVKGMSEKVTVKYNVKNAPGVFTDGKRTCLLMPMHLG